MNMNYKGEWKKWKVSGAFIRSLQEHFPDTPFTNRMAYIVYYDHHSRQREQDELWLSKLDVNTQPAVLAHLERNRGPNDHWLQMNVRNHLSAAVRKGLYNLVRLEPGVYQFEE